VCCVAQGPQPGFCYDTKAYPLFPARPFRHASTADTPAPSGSTATPGTKRARDSEPQPEAPAEKRARKSGPATSDVKGAGVEPSSGCPAPHGIPDPLSGLAERRRIVPQAVAEGGSALGFGSVGPADAVEGLGFDPAEVLGDVPELGLSAAEADAYWEHYISVKEDLVMNILQVSIITVMSVEREKMDHVGLPPFL
jgi:hypothetical protein